MAVTTSSGNGFALYNGVKLPDINEVWTDKVEKPYALVTSNYKVNDITSSYQLFLSDQIITAREYAGGTASVRNVSGSIANLAIYGYSDGAWFFITNFSLSNDKFLTGSGSFVFASFDVYDRTPALYLSASTPISLDGMNVIEWDGDTTGLEKDGSHYRVYDSISPTSTIAVRKNADDSLTVGTFFEKFVEVGMWTSGLNMEEFPFAFGGDDIGTWFSKETGTPNDPYCCLLAYPASGGGEDGGESTAQKHYCRVNGSVHEVEGGTARISGSYHEIEVGTVRIEGAYYEIPFSGGSEGGGGGGSFDGWLLKDGEALVEFTKVALNSSNNAALDNSAVLWQDGYVQLKPGSFTATVPNPAGGTMETQVPILPFLVSAYEIDMSQWSTLHFVYRGYAQFGYGSLTGTYNSPIAWMQSNYNNNSSSYVEETIDLDSGANGRIAIGMYNTAANSTLYITDIWLT